MNTNGDYSDPAEQEWEGPAQPDATRRYEIEPSAAGEPFRAAAPTETVEIRIPPGRSNLPVTRPLSTAPRTG